jgi:TP901 family phage tail tape measure protein
MGQAYDQTNLMIKAVNQLTTSLDGMTKKIGKKLLLFSAADTAALIGMTALTARYEKQLSTLRAQTEIANKSFNTYKQGITNLSKELPKTRGELVQLVTQIEHLGITSERETLKFARVFTNLSGATGDDVASLTQGMIELGRAMGTLGGGAGQMEKFSDSLTTVSAEAGVAATSVVNFANSISPFARAAGIGEAALLGISAAFTRAGADGYAAANTFNTMVADITRQIQNGSPELAKYANVMGVTVDQFKRLDMGERMSGIFDAVNKAGPNAIRILDRLGFDGIRAAKSIAAVSNEAGGLKRAIDTSVEAYGSGSTQKGANAAFDTMDAKLTMLRNQMEIFGSAIGEAILPPAKALLNVLNNMATSVSGFVEPLLKAAGLMGAILAPFTAAAGVLMNLMGPLSTLMMGFMAMRFTPMRAFLEGSKEGVAQKAGVQGAGPSTIMGQNMAKWEAEKAAAAAAGVAPNTALRPAWYQRAGYNLGMAAGGTRAGVGLSRFSLPTLRGLGTATADLTRTLASGYGSMYRDASLTGQAMYDKPSMARGLEGPLSRVAGRFGAMREAVMNPGEQGVMKSFQNNLKVSEAALKAQTAAATAQTAATASSTAATTTDAAAKAADAGATQLTMKARFAEANAYIRASGSVTAFTTSLMGATKALVMLPLQAGAFGLRAGGQMLGGAGRMAGSLLGGVGGILGIGAGATAGLLGAGLIGYRMKESADKMRTGLLGEDSMPNLSATNTALGLTTDALRAMSHESLRASRQLMNLTDAARLTTAEQQIAKERDYADPEVANLGSKESAVAYLQSMGDMSGKPEQLRSLTMDITKKYGNRLADEIMTQYLAQTTGGTNALSAGTFGSQVVAPRLFDAESEASKGFVGYARSIPLIGGVINATSKDDNALKATDQVWTAAETFAQETAKKFGDAAGYMAEQSAEYDIMSESLNLSTVSGPGAQIGQRSLEQFQKQHGDLGLFIDPETHAITSGGPLGQNVQNPNDFYTEMFNPKNTTPGAVDFRTEAEGRGLNLEDYLNNGKGIRDQLNEYSIPQMSDFDKRVRGTTLGAQARDSAGIMDVTEGTHIGDPSFVRKALDEMSASALENAKSGDTVTTQFQRLKNAVGDTTDTLYQLAAAAMKEVQSTEMYRAKSGGWMAEFSTRWGQITEQLATPNLQEDEKQTLINERREMTNDIRGRLEQIILAEKQYQLTRFRAQRDYDINMNRSIAATSASWQNAYSRGANQQQLTNSPGLISFNAQEQLGTAKGQLAGLRKLTGMGLSEDARNMLNLTDASMGNQTIRLAQTADKEWVAVQNQLAAERKKVVDSLTKEFSTPFKNAEEDFKRAAADAATDMQLMGQIATGTIKQLVRQATGLAKLLGIENMAALVQVISTLGVIDEEDKDTAKRTKKQTVRDQEALRFSNYSAVNGVTDSYGTSSISPVTGDRVVTASTLDPSIARSLPINTTFLQGDQLDSASQLPPPLPNEKRYWGVPFQKPWEDAQGRLWPNWFVYGPQTGKEIELGTSWGNPELSQEQRQEIWDRKVAGHAMGGITTSAHKSWVGEAGPEAIIPLNARGVDILAEALGKAFLTMDVVKGAGSNRYGTPQEYRGGGTTVYNNSTNYSIGTMTVEAQDPEEMQRKLDARTRRSNLRKNPSTQMK